MLRRRLVASLLVLFAVLGIGAAVYAQLETSDRGILPLDTSNTLEIGPVHVDVGAADAQSARLAGWRMAQRQGFRALWAKMHNAPVNQAPNLPDGTLDQIVSSINVDRELLGPNRYIADLRVEFDRGRAAPFLGVEGGQITEHSVPMLLIPVTVTAGTETSVEFRNAWQRAWAQFRTAQTPINYVRVSGMGTDPMLVNAAQTTRPGRGWWRALLDMYGAQDILIAEVQLQRAYPGGPARARFIARHGPDNEVVGGFTLTAPNSDAMPAMMAAGCAADRRHFRPGARRRTAVARSVAQPAAAAGAGAARAGSAAETGQCRQRLSGAGHRHRRDHLQFRDGPPADSAGDRLGNSAADQPERDQLHPGRLPR